MARFENHKRVIVLLGAIIALSGTISLFILNKYEGNGEKQPFLSKYHLNLHPYSSGQGVIPYRRL